MPRETFNRKPTGDIVFDGNGNCGTVWHHFRDIHSWKVAWPWLTFRKVYTAERFMILILTFTMGQGQMFVSIARLYATFYLLAIAMFAPSVTVCETIKYELPSDLDSNIWSLKMKVNDVDDLDDYRLVNVSCWHVYVCQNRRFWARQFVRGTYSHISRRTYGRTHYLLINTVQLCWNSVKGREVSIQTIVAPPCRCKKGTYTILCLL